MSDFSYSRDDPIAALATPWSSSALAVIRTSGKGCIDTVSSLFFPKERLSRAEGNTLHRGTLFSTDGTEPLDDIVAAVYRAPKSYTGEDSVELFIHGGLPGIKRILDTLFQCGIRPASPGEFTLRAFLNGKMDLTRAEAVNEIVNAKSDQARSLALHRLAGSIEGKINGVKSELLRIVGAVELQLDYSDDEGEAEDRSIDIEGVAAVRKECEGLAATYSSGRVYQQGIRAVLAGKTNVGKSSLFNLFLREDRSIVSEIHGTTRDYIESWISVDGIPVQLFDTAGLRTAAEAIEQEGIRRTESMVLGADVVIYLVDGCLGIDDEDEKRMGLLRDEGTPVIYVWSKMDLTSVPAPDGFIPVSTVSLEGFRDLEKALGELALRSKSTGGGDAVIDSLRQKELLDRAAEDLRLVEEAAADGMPLDVISLDLSDALSALGEITGEVTTEDILQTIFRNFCVGK